MAFNNPSSVSIQAILQSQRLALAFLGLIPLIHMLTTLLGWYRVGESINTSQGKTGEKNT
jgi:hypothetical protein